MLSSRYSSGAEIYLISKSIFSLCFCCFIKVLKLFLNPLFGKNGEIMTSNDDESSDCDKIFKKFVMLGSFQDGFI